MRIYDDAPALQRSVDQKGSRLFSLLLASTQARITTYVPLAKAIEEEGHRAVVAVPRHLKPEDEELARFEGVEFAWASDQEVTQLRGVDVLFSPEARKTPAPPGAATVGIFHSLPDVALRAGAAFVSPGANHLRTAPTSIRAFDYFALAVRQRDWTESSYSFIKGVYPQRFFEGRRDHLDIVPAGYPKLDYLRQLLAGAQEPDSIVYCPTSVSSRVSRVREDGERILRALLDRFPSFRIVFRPYPAASDRQIGRALAAPLASDPRLIFDETPTGTDYQRNSALAVTDSSSSAITFAIGLGRPLVSVNLSDEAEAGSKRSDAVKTLPFGYSARTTGGLIEAVQSGSAKAVQWADSITAAAGKHLYNPGTASTYLATHLRTFALRGSHKDWLSIDREPWRPTGEPGEVEKHLEKLRDWSGEASGALNPHQQRMYDEIAEYLTSGQRIDLAASAR